jgi:imidazolonepropionase-like amidohydrolase
MRFQATPAALASLLLTATLAQAATPPVNPHRLPAPGRWCRAGSLLDRPGQAPRGASTVLIRDGRVVAVRDGHVARMPSTVRPSTQTVMTCATATCCPGLIDSHVHLTSTRPASRAS